MPNRTITALCAMAAWAAGCSSERSRRNAKWPQRPIQITCFSSPGGGTDTVDRKIAKAMEPFLGVKINVINKKGAHGGFALRDVWRRKHDGYRWGGFSESILVASVMKGHDTTAKDWTYFMVAGAPGVISVRADSEYKTLKQLVDAARSRPGKINAAASGAGGIWHTKLIALERAAGITFNYLPFAGSNPSQLAVLSGEAEVALTSVSEQAELIKAKQLRPLAMVEADAYDFPGLGKIVAAADAYPDVGKVPITQWLGFALPADTPTEVLEKITGAFKQAVETDEIKTLTQTRLLTRYGYYGEKANAVVRETERVWTWLLYDLKIAERSPAELGIPKP